jgi:hypothetical protein
MMTRRWLGLVLLAAVWLVGEAELTVDTPVTSSSTATAADVAELRDRLEAGLLARQPREFAFIGRVVTMVEGRRLPLDLVMSTFQWARRKKPYPFPYFERALRTRAARLGIAI